jgi:hypothetical protein
MAAVTASFRLAGWLVAYGGVVLEAAMSLTCVCGAWADALDYDVSSMACEGRVSSTRYR